jgi:hypothetical protein
VWRAGRRLRKLESELAATRAEQAELRRRLRLFEEIAAAAGAVAPDVSRPGAGPRRQPPAPIDGSYPASAPPGSEPAVPSPVGYVLPAAAGWPDGGSTAEPVVPGDGLALPDTRSAAAPHGSAQPDLSPADLAAERVPPELMAAARELRSHEVPVRMRVAGAELAVVVEGPGDPARWWQAIREVAHWKGTTR